MIPHQTYLGAESPAQLSIYEAPCSDLPSLVSYYYGHGLSRAGIGIGYGDAAVRSAAGEYIERGHFQHYVHAESKSPLAACGQDLEESFVHALSQTALSDRSDKGLIATHAFYMSRAYQLRDYAPTWCPTVLLRLHDSPAEDRAFFPLKDSSGSACHTSAEVAVDKALGEFLERQSLLASWLDGSSVKQLLLDEQALPTDLSRHCLQALRCNGEVVLFDISLGLPSYTVLALFIGSGDRTVHYAAGASGNRRPAAAVEKAILELWHGHFAMALNSAPRNIISDREAGRLEVNYDRANHDGKLTQFSFVGAAEHEALAAYLEKPELSMREQAARTCEISPNVLVYLGHQWWHGSPRYFAKVLSPDFFLHLEHRYHFNADCLFSRRLGLDLANLRVDPVPFS